MERWIGLALLVIVLATVFLWLIWRARRIGKRAQLSEYLVNHCDAEMLPVQIRVVLNSRTDELARLGFNQIGYYSIKGKLGQAYVSNGAGYGAGYDMAYTSSIQFGAMWLSADRTVLAIIIPAQGTGSAISFASRFSAKEQIVTSVREAQAVSAVIGPHRSVMNMLTGTLSHQLAVHQTRCEASEPKQLPQLIDGPLMLVQNIMLDHALDESGHQSSRSSIMESAYEKVITRLGPIFVRPWIFLLSRLGRLGQQRGARKSFKNHKRQGNVFSRSSFGQAYASSETVRWALWIVVALLIAAAFLGGLVSIVAAMIAWGVYLTGRYLVMRYYGYMGIRLHASLLPFPGVFVDGSYPGSMTIWKEITVILAGPVFGVLIASLIMAIAPLAILWGGVFGAAAVYLLMFIAFNMLPVYPLVGGTIIDLLVGPRWPRVRMTYAGISALLLLTLGTITHSIFMVLIAVLVFLGLPPIRRTLPAGLRYSNWLISFNEHPFNYRLSRTQTLVSLVAYTVFLVLFYVFIFTGSGLFRFLMSGILY